MISIVIGVALLISQVAPAEVPAINPEATAPVSTAESGAPLLGETQTTPTIRLVNGFSHILKVPLLDRVVIGDPKILTASVIAPDEILLVPHLPILKDNATDVTNMIIKTTDGMETEFKVFIDSKNVVLEGKRTVGVKVYVVEVYKSYKNDLGLQWVDAMHFQEDPIPIPGLTEVGPIKRTTPFFSDLRALVQQGKARILSSPTLVTLEGKSAEFFVGGQIPIVASAGIGGVGSVTWKNYGVDLKITPTIDLQNYINLSLKPEVSTLDWVNSVQSGGYTLPSLKTRRINASIRVRSGETVGLGGLVSTQSSYHKTGVPLLSAIPLIGNLFSVKTKINDDAEIVFLVTPSILPKSLSIVEVWDRDKSNTYDFPLLVRENTVLVPIDEIAKVLGCHVKKTENEVVFTYKGKKIRVNYDTQSLLIGQQLNEIYVENYFGNMMVELKVLKQVFSNLEIMWDKYQNVLHIIKHVKRI